MKQVVKIIVLIVISMYGLVGCTTSEIEYKASMTMEELADEIIQEVEFEMIMAVELDDAFQAELLFDTCGLNVEWVEEGAIFTNSRVSPDTLFVVEAVDIEVVDLIEEAFVNQREYLAGLFEFYLPENFEKAMQGEVVKKGKYVMLVISNDNEKAVNIFDSAIN